MNLYDLYNNPEGLNNFNERLSVPAIAYHILTERDGEYLDMSSEELARAVKSIATDPKLSVNYTINEYEGSRFKEAEPVIMKDPVSAYKYTRDVINSKSNRWSSKPNIRWPEAEPYIMKNPKIAGLYASDIIKGRWPEAEPYIKQSETWWAEYLELMEYL